MDKETINIGVLGTANIAKKAIIPNLKELPDKFNLVGIGSRDAGKGHAFSKEQEIPFLGDYDDVLNTANIQAVYIPLPNSLHFEWIKKAIVKDIHVLSEKPLACTLDEVIELTALAQKRKIVLVENFQFRFHNQLAFINNVIKNGKIGEIKCLKSYFGFPAFKDLDNIRYQKELGGGALLDAGTYPLKIIQYFLGTDIVIDSAKLNYDTEKGVDIGGGAFIKQKDGSKFAFAAFGFDNFYQCSIEIWGCKGKIYTNRIFTAPPGYRPEILIETASGKENVVLEPDNHYRNMLMYFYQLIKNDEGREEEYQQNIIQASLINQLRLKANEQ